MAKRANSHLILIFSSNKDREIVPIDPFELGSLTQKVSKKLLQDFFSHAFIATLLFGPSISALPVIVRPGSPSVGLFNHQ